MHIYLWPEGHWAYEWDKVAIAALSRLYGPARTIDLDKNTEYDLSKEELEACLEAINEADY